MIFRSADSARIWGEMVKCRAQPTSALGPPPARSGENGTGPVGRGGIRLVGGNGPVRREQPVRRERACETGTGMWAEMGRWG